jgi:hypothetical protein
LPYKSKAANINNSNREALNTSIDQANNRKNNTKNSSKNKNISKEKSIQNTTNISKAKESKIKISKEGEYQNFGI